MSAFPECRHDVADRLEKHLVMAEREPGVVDALGVDQAEAEIPEMIVVGGGDGELEPRHASFLIF